MSWNHYFNIIQNHLPSFTSLIKWRTIDLDHSNLTIEVDETVSSLDIKINGTIDASEVFLRNPSGMYGTL